MLVVDATTGLGLIVLALPIVLIVFVIGRAVRQRTAMSAELRARTAELRHLRDQRVSLELTSDRFVSPASSTVFCRSGSAS